MSHFIHDEDEWETVITSTPCRSCQGDLRKCNGMCSGSSGVVSRRRAPEDVAKIKADRKRKNDDEILAKAELIRRERAAVGDDR